MFYNITKLKIISRLKLTLLWQIEQYLCHFTSNAVFLLCVFQLLCVSVCVSTFGYKCVCLILCFQMFGSMWVLVSNFVSNFVCLIACVHIVYLNVWKILFVLSCFLFMCLSVYVSIAWHGFSRGVVVNTSPNPKAGGPPLVGCPRKSGEREYFQTDNWEWESASG